ncbi:GTPase HflX [Bacilli bacterium]|uniref:GTPase HflX n=1 Tax=Oceanobacillus caeni TaxID=405946 RepID=UPI00062210DF|nr:GTPase HflX [Oceanobacillus caeni]KKE78441.1 GTPase [Bacilli bacterium VT-13-104]PZD87796.1 GTPase HflX [Bacilli bacterium]MBU8792205.1 GTPase HflX [Oceanobacillus caeni]PZD88602.1 GTPase HflX [Bacilli bacterium]PZD89895.1 GTPase HflX [Bacilli bacterium]
MPEEKILIIAVKKPTQKDEQFQSSLEELISLGRTAGGNVVETITQNRNRIHPATYIGEGKMEEIKQEVEKLDIDLVISNDELSPGQLRNLSNFLGVRIIDRSQLILDIFARRAKTKEGKLQVELAQLEYMLPRLAGHGVEMSRLGAGIGTRGPGETKLETDRRHIRNRIVDIKRKLKIVVRQREQYRKRRKTNEAFQIAIVGYTNAGKSTIFNRLTKSDSLEEDKLFATLDPLTRKINFPSGFEALVTDTVGFLQDLPTALIAAFRSTLEEVKEADFLIHVVDASQENQEEQQRTVMKLLAELDSHTIPMLTVYNKKDLLQTEFFPIHHPNILISAYNHEELNQMLAQIEKIVMEQWKSYSIQINDGNMLAKLERDTIITAKQFDEQSNKFNVSGYIRANHPLNHLMN